MKDQLAAVVRSLALLTDEVKALKEAKADSGEVSQRSDISNNDENDGGNISAKRGNIDGRDGNQSAWLNKNRTEEMKKSMKVTMCIKSNQGVAVDLNRVKEIITTHGVQVTKASVDKKSGDLYVNFPSEENREKLFPLSEEEQFPGNKVINLKKRYPTISIRGVSDYDTEDEFKSQKSKSADKRES